MVRETDERRACAARATRCPASAQPAVPAAHGRGVCGVCARLHGKRRRMARVAVARGRGSGALARPRQNPRASRSRVGIHRDESARRCDRATATRRRRADRGACMGARARRARTARGASAKRAVKFLTFCIHCA